MVLAFPRIIHGLHGLYPGSLSMEASDFVQSLELARETMGCPELVIPDVLNRGRFGPCTDRSLTAEVLTKQIMPKG